HWQSSSARFCRLIRTPAGGLPKTSAPLCSTCARRLVARCCSSLSGCTAANWSCPDLLWRLDDYRGGRRLGGGPHAGVPLVQLPPGPKLRPVIKERMVVGSSLSRQIFRLREPKRDPAGAHR